MNLKKIKIQAKYILSYAINLRYFFYDLMQCLKHSFLLNNTEEKSKALISISMHSLEKGLCFSKKKENWGGEKSIYLTRLLREHIKVYGKCDVVVVALNVLNAYLADDSSLNSFTLRSEINELLDENKSDLRPNIGGAKFVTCPEFTISYKDILHFFSTRVSVRDFSLQNISKDEIARAKQIARTTPTACNRQTSRIHVFQDKNTICKILDNQLGDQGWGKNADTLFIITSNLSYFGDTYERNQVYIDGGMYAMNFMIGLHAQKIASCFKMYLREPILEKQFKEIAKIPQQEIPIVLVLAGHYLDTAFSPISYRMENIDNI